MDWSTLKRFSIFEAFEEPLLRQIAEKADLREFDDGVTIFSEGDAGDAAYFVVNGAVRIEKVIDAQRSDTRTLSIVGAGEFFGEMSLLDRSPRSAAAIARGRCALIQVSRSAFEALLAKQHEAAARFLFAVIQALNDRVRRLSSTVVVFHEIGKAIGETTRLSDLLDVILRQLFQATAATWGLLLLKPEFADRLEVQSQIGCSLTPEQKRGLADGEGVAGHVFRESQEALINNIDDDDRFRDVGRGGYESPALIALPIAAGSAKLGLVLLGHSQPGHFDANALNLCVGVARQAAQAILNARHREEEESRSKLGRRYVKF
jgi:CRP-like cAMP-binding protein